MNRIIWMGIGVAIGVIAFRKITEAQSALGPEGLNRAVGRLADGVYDFADAPADYVAATEALYKHLQLIPQDASLADMYLDLLAAQVIGLYDDDAKSMFVVIRDGSVGPPDEVTYAHEFTHALQDQKFGIKNVIGDAKQQGDRALARSALVEGDAMLLMSLWAQKNLTPAELAQVGSAGGDPASKEVLNTMPAILKEPLLFPYTQGLQLALNGFTNGGGFAGVDAIFANPPDSTEQLLHLGKLASREEPVPVVVPDDLASRLGTGWKMSLQDTLGELQLGIVLKGSGAKGPLDAAAGWGGDRVALLEGPDGAQAVVLDTAWDTAADAEEYAKAVQSVADRLIATGKSASVLRPSGQRVVLVSATSADVLGRVANVLGLAG